MAFMLWHGEASYLNGPLNRLEALTKRPGHLPEKAEKVGNSPKRRRARSPRKVKSMARRRMAVPHPSITGMAAGFSLLDDLNQGDVADMALKGNMSDAIKRLSINSQLLIKTDSGRKSLVQAVGIAAIGAWARRSFPSTKLGGSKFFFRI